MGPGVEPPENRDSAPNSGANTGGGGAGGMAGAAAGAGGGFANPGSGGTDSAAGAGGNGGTGGSGRPSTGAGGASGTGANGEDGSSLDGGLAPEAPSLECERGRDALMLLEAALAGPNPSCTAQLSSSALDLTRIALAVTPDPESVDATTWPQRKSSSGECDESQAFYIDGSFGVPRISLCPALCDALIATGVENVTLELIYGCDPPE